MAKTVLIDGENFVHSLLEVLGGKTRKTSRQELLTLDIRRLLETALKTKDLEILYFGTKLRLDTASGSLRSQVEKTRQFQSQWINVLRKQDIAFVKAGYLRVREGALCKKCGHQEQYLLEKGLDVAVAVRMVQLAAKGKELIVVSRDTDLLPAYFAAKEKGAKITYVDFDKHLLYALAATADKTVAISRKLLKSCLHG